MTLAKQQIKENHPLAKVSIYRLFPFLGYCCITNNKKKKFNKKVEIFGKNEFKACNIAYEVEKDRSRAIYVKDKHLAKKI